MLLGAPIIITDTEFDSSSINEPDTGETLYNPATTYDTGEKALVTGESDNDYNHWIYISLKDGNTGNYPPNNLTGDDPWWAKYQRSNRWRMWDNRAGSVSTYSGELVVQVTPGSLYNTVALFDLAVTALNVNMYDSTAGEVYDVDVEMIDLNGINDYYQWFFYPLKFKKNVILIDLPPYTNAYITITASNSGGATVIGEFVTALSLPIGEAGYPFTYAIDNYNRKSRDLLDFPTIEQREFVNSINYRFVGYSKLNNYVKSEIGKYVNDPALFIGYLVQDQEYGDESIIFGFVKSYSANVGDKNITVHSLRVEELI